MSYNSQATMVRVGRSQVHRSRGFAFIEAAGDEWQARGGGRHPNYYMLTDVGAGVYNLRLIGTWAGIMSFLGGNNEHGMDGIMNTRKYKGGGVNTIGVTVGRYRAPVSKGLFPGHDLAAKVASGAASFAAGGIGGANANTGAAHTVLQVGGAANDFASGLRSHFGHRKKHSNPSGASFFAEFAQSGDVQLGKRFVNFDDCMQPILDLIMKCSKR